MASTSAYYTDTAVTLSPVAAPAASPDILINPRFTLIAAAKTGSISSQMVDCGLGGSACANATGKICLIQRGGGLLFCTKVSNCVADGGVAALIYGRDDQPECEQITSVTLVSDQCVEPAGGWPIVMLATRKQGLYIKNVTASQPSTTVTLNTGAEDYSLGIMSGTSMATPAAAGELCCSRWAARVVVCFVGGWVGAAGGLCCSLAVPVWVLLCSSSCSLLLMYITRSLQSGTLVQHCISHNCEPPPSLPDMKRPVIADKFLFICCLCSVISRGRCCRLGVVSPH